jgi:hypothetical protein
VVPSAGVQSELETTENGVPRRGGVTPSLSPTEDANTVPPILFEQCAELDQRATFSASPAEWSIRNPRHAVPVDVVLCVRPDKFLQEIPRGGDPLVASQPGRPLNPPSSGRPA